MATSRTLQNGPEIERLRVEAGLTRPELARRIGVHRTYIRLIEREERNAQPPVISAIADALGCNVKKILRGHRAAQRARAQLANLPRTA